MFIMNWQAVRSLTIVQVGALLALLIVAVMPNFGLKYGASPALPALLLAFLGGWLLWKERARLFEAPETWTPPALSRGLLYVQQNEPARNGAKPRLICYDLRAK